MGRALFAILQTLMPQEDTYIRLQLESVANDSCNEFELLWILQKKFFTMFDLTKEPIRSSTLSLTTLILCQTVLKYII
jgi:hypothetical protein